ncbi:hypothetical protein HDV05_004041 [Chytridiales sp. JEL 0842]|nr:hypothetical protein HDV05_004041 [Chytridiales sp. JEL 0842]
MLPPANLIASLAVLLLVAGSRSTQAQALFGDGDCLLDVPRFDGMPPGLQLDNGKVAYSNGVMLQTLQPPPPGSNIGLNTRVSTSKSLLYGTVTARVKQDAQAVGGVITALVLWNEQTKDEIDWEWVGSESQRRKAWTNFFYRGLRERDPKTTFEIWSSNPTVPSDTHENFHDYKIEWTPYALTWSIDNVVVHTQPRNATYQVPDPVTGLTGDGLREAHYHYPDTPLQIQLGIWNSNEVAWAEGPVDWTRPEASEGFTAHFASLKVECYRGPFPSDMNAPPSDSRCCDNNPSGGSSGPARTTSSATGVVASPVTSTGSSGVGPTGTTGVGANGRSSAEEKVVRGVWGLVTGAVLMGLGLFVF